MASYEAKWGEGGTGDAAETGAEFAGTKSIFPSDLSPELTQRMLVNLSRRIRDLENAMNA